MKDKIAIGLVIFAVGAIGFAAVENQKAAKLSSDLNQERYSRMDKEEKLQTASGRIKSLESTSSTTQKEVQAVQSQLENQKTENVNLKTELEKTEKLKDVLEKQLKEALVAQPSGQAGGEAAPSQPVSEGQ